MGTKEQQGVRRGSTHASPNGLWPGTLHVLRGQRKPGSTKGEPSIEVFGLGRTILVVGRRDAWLRLEVLLAAYATSVEKGDEEHARRIEAAARNSSFSGVLSFMLEIAEGPAAAALIEPSCLQALRDHPKIYSWV